MRLKPVRMRPNAHLDPVLALCTLGALSLVSVVLGALHLERSALDAALAAARSAAPGVILATTLFTSGDFRR